MPIMKHEIDNIIENLVFKTPNRIVKGTITNDK